jgi:hypothetical protein
VDAKADDILHLVHALEQLLFHRRIVISRYDLWPPRRARLTRPRLVDRRLLDTFGRTGG